MKKISLNVRCEHCGGFGYNYSPDSGGASDYSCNVACTHCGGVGTDYSKNFKQGSGKISKEFMMSDEDCPHCKGEGKFYHTHRVNKTTWYGKSFVCDETTVYICSHCLKTGKKLHTIKQCKSTCSTCDGKGRVFSHHIPTKSRFIKFFHPDAQIIESKICPSCNGKPYKKWEEYTYTNNPKL